MGECPNPELSEAVAVGEEPGVSQAEETVTLEPWGMFQVAGWAGTVASCPGWWTLDVGPLLHASQMYEW